MKNRKNNINRQEYKYGSIRNIISGTKYLSMSLLILGLTACDSFLEIDPPKNTLVAETVFEDEATVESALANIYYKMRDDGMVSGNFGLSVLMGTYTDELDYFGTNANILKLYSHNVTASDDIISNWWSRAYYLIYAANDIIKGLENSSNISVEEKNNFKGQALFVRGFLHSLLVELYGDVPYINTPNYLENKSVVRMPLNTVYDGIIDDLNNAVILLQDTDASGEHVIPNKSAANALLARIYLYSGNWALAESISTKLIDTHGLETDINKVFLKDSQETLWQFKPGKPSIDNTQEGQTLVITFIPTRGYALTDDLLAAFEPGDSRRSNWVGSITSTNGLTTLHFAYKYKETINTTKLSLEYSVVFRLAEQYLIRAEAKAHLGDVSGAQTDLNVIRNRAGLGNTTATTMDGLLDAILQERRVELFTEHAHRWFDLKRTGKASEVLAPIKSNWLNTQVLLPIPETELLANPNLKPQNDGY